MAKTRIQRKQYILNRSPFFKLESKQRLAVTLSAPLVNLERLASAPSNTVYNMFDDEKSGRFITEPHGELKRIHKRIAKLFGRVSPPLFLQSATKKRSYKTNAQMHLGHSNVFKVDIRQYYPSISFGAVYRFFQKKMKCSPDVATILSKICTVSVKGRTHLPTGSSLSPILSYWVYSDLFDEINALCVSKGCVMTLYVDDITVSGASANKELIAQIEEIIRQAGLTAHKIKIFDGAPATITGVIVHGNRLALPHDRAKDIRELQGTIRSMPIDTVDPVLSKLVGKLNEAQQFVAGYGAIKKALLAEHAIAWKRITDDRVGKSRKALERRRSRNAPPKPVSG